MLGWKKDVQPEQMSHQNQFLPAEKTLSLQVELCIDQCYRQLLMSANTHLHPMACRPGGNSVSIQVLFCLIDCISDFAACFHISESMRCIAELKDFGLESMAAVSAA